MDYIQINEDIVSPKVRQQFKRDTATFVHANFGELVKLFLPFTLVQIVSVFLGYCMRDSSSLDFVTGVLAIASVILIVGMLSTLIQLYIARDDRYAWFKPNADTKEYNFNSSDYFAYYHQYKAWHVILVKLMTGLISIALLIALVGVITLSALYMVIIPALGFTMLAVGIFAGIPVIFYVLLGLSLADLCFIDHLNDPHEDRIGVFGALHLSWKIMSGKRWNYLVYNLSMFWQYLGYGILPIFFGWYYIPYLSIMRLNYYYYSVFKGVTLNGLDKAVVDEVKDDRKKGKDTEAKETETSDKPAVKVKEDTDTKGNEANNGKPNVKVQASEDAENDDANKEDASGAGYTETFYPKSDHDDKGNQGNKDK